MSQVAKRVVFIGRVQGIGFRFTAYNIAKRNLLTGFVRNQLDGSVEMVVQGEPEDVEDCIRDIEASFPGSITQTQIDDTAFNAEYTDFKITF